MHSNLYLLLSQRCVSVFASAAVDPRHQAPLWHTSNCTSTLALWIHFAFVFQNNVSEIWLSLYHASFQNHSNFKFPPRSKYLYTGTYQQQMYVSRLLSVSGENKMKSPSTFLRFSTIACHFWRPCFWWWWWY